MALFTNKADSKLPALTQLYQVTVWPRDEDEAELAYGYRLLNTPAGDELRTWVVKVAGLDESESEGRLPSAFLTSRSGLSLGAGESFETAVFLGGSLKSGEEFIVWLADLHFFLCELMSCAADDRVPHKSQVQHLNELLAKYAPPQIVWHPAFKVDGQPEISIEKDAVDFFYPHLEAMPPFVGTVESLEQFIGRLLLREFYQALTRHQFARCEVCQSVFWKTYSKALYCSRRCTSRQSQRNWAERRLLSNQD